MRSEKRKTKIVCTIGPATGSPAMLRNMIEAGMDVARLNFSHGNHESHSRLIGALRRASEDAGKEIGILQDLQGPKIRVGRLPETGITLSTDQTIHLVPGETSDPGTLPIGYAHLLDDVKPGDRILLADGSVELQVSEIRQSSLVCSVLVGGEVHSSKGVNLPSSTLKVSVFTEKDRNDLEFGLKKNVDFVALSFISHEHDVEPVLEILNRQEQGPMLIAKIERPQALDRFDAIMNRVGGIMVARGDLGVEMPLAKVPMIQKRLIRAARNMGKPVITATQMLRSMVDSPRPTRAEATDVANAVLDGTDAVMLSEETATGRFPLEAVRVLDRICHETEPYLEVERFLKDPISDLLPPLQTAISRSAAWLAHDLNADAIIAFTASGSTARTVSRFRPPQPVIAFTDKPATQRQLSLSWGVSSVEVTFTNIDEMIEKAKSWAIENEMAHRGDRIILTAGLPIGVTGTTNLLKAIELT
ncbi:MAG: pyruvate kinase [Desulfobacterales bacterium]